MSAPLRDNLSAPNLVAFVALLAQGCATVEAPQEITKETTLSRTEVPHRLSSAIVVDSKRLEGDSSLTVSLSEETLCFDTVREVVRTRKYNKSETKNVGLDVAGAFAGVVAGTTLLLVAPSLSSMSRSGNSGDSASPREEAQALGATALVAGALFAGDAVVVALHGRPQLIRTDTSPRDTRSEKGRYRCSTKPVHSGTVVAIIDERRIELPVKHSGHKMTIDLRASLDERCGSDINGTETARVVYRATDQSEIPLANVPLANCVTAAKARSHLREARMLVQRSDGSSLLRAINEAGQTESLVQVLPDSDRAKAEIRSDLNATKREIDSSISSLGDGLVASIAKAKPSGADLVREGSAALALAARAARPARIWPSTMQSISERLSPGARGYLEMVAIVKNAGLKDCLINNWQCPDWLTNEMIAASTQRLSADFVRGNGATAKQIASASRALSRTPTLKNGLAAEAAMGAATDWIEACSSENELHVPSVRTACADLMAKAEDARKVIAGKDETLTHLKEEAAQRERNEQQKKALREWKGHFALCRKLGAALPEAERLRDQGRCGAECQEAIKKMRKDVERLGQFQGDASLDESTMETVRRECQEAGCPNCP